MGILLAKLESDAAALDPPLTAVISARQDSQVQPTQLGWSNDTAGVAKLDRLFTGRFTARENYVLAEMRNAAIPFSWPLSADAVAQLYANMTGDEQTVLTTGQLDQAAEAVRLYVLGDVFLQISQREKEYVDKAAYYLGHPMNPRDLGQAAQTLKAAKDSLIAAIKIWKDGGDTVEEEDDVEIFTFVPVRDRCLRGVCY
jgi:hypothetical protein